MCCAKVALFGGFARKIELVGQRLGEFAAYPGMSTNGVERIGAEGERIATNTSSPQKKGNS
jgi:hypothetical protein